MDERAARAVGLAWPLAQGWQIEFIRLSLAVNKRAAKKKAKPAKVAKKPKKAEGFYSSWDWKRARYEALRINGNRCQCCGWQPGDTPQGWLVVDHIKPRKKFPALALDTGNLQVLCNDCNMGKSDVHMQDFRDRADAFALMTWAGA